MVKKQAGLILKIDENIEIKADSQQYILIYDSKYSYFPTLEFIFQEIFEQKLKDKLIENKKKSMETIIQIHKEVSDYLKNIFKDIERPEFDR